MSKMFTILGATAGGYLGWWLGDLHDMMAAFLISMIGTGIGMYYGTKFGKTYLG